MSIAKQALAWEAVLRGGRKTTWEGGDFEPSGHSSRPTTSLAEQLDLHIITTTTQIIRPTIYLDYGPLPPHVLIFDSSFNLNRKFP